MSDLAATERSSRRGARKQGLAALAVIATLAFTADAATASPPRPIDLRINRGTDAWYADNHFSLEWAAPASSEPAPTATLYRVRDRQGAPIDSGRFFWAGEQIYPLTVPPIPGAYGLEVWFEDASGAQGPAATAQLRFDDTKPAPVKPEAVPAWIGRSTFPLRVSLGHPPGPLPISGIRGYAVAIDADPATSPCAAADRCAMAETTLSGGIENDTVEIAALPEGTRYLHAVAISGSGMKSTSTTHAELRVDLTDPVTHLSGAPAGWTNRPVSISAHATDGGSGMAPRTGSLAPYTAIAIDGSAPATAAGPVATTVIAEGIHRVAYYARDAAGNVDDGGWSNGVANRQPQTATVRIDRTPPSIDFANAQDPHDPELLRASIDDALSGADPSRGWIGVRPAGSGERFSPLPALPAAVGELRARWDSDSYPPGRYEFRAAGFDTAGNAAATTKRRNGAAMILRNPLKATTGLAASFAGNRLRQTIPYGRGVLVGGRLTTGIRSPLAGAAVRVVEHFAAGARPATRVSTVTTDPNGAYSLRLMPGPSREVTAMFAGNQGLGRSISDTLSLAVRSSVRLRASSATAAVGGAPLVFRGTVGPHEAIPASGLPAELQFRLAGLPWSEFRTVQTDRRGRFRYAYRFSDDDSRGARFQFRAYVPAHENWPYEPASSRPILVRGY